MVQFGQQYWFQSKIPEQYMSKMPQQQVAPTPIRQQMKTYNVEWTILPWVSDDKAKKIVDYAKQNSKSKEEEKILLNDLHQQAVKREQIEMYKKEREANKAEMVKYSMEAKDPEEKKQVELSLKLSNFSDIVRDWLKKQWIDARDIDDKEVVKRFVTDNPDKKNLVTDYLNWNMQGVDVAKKLGIIKDEEATKESNLWKNIAIWAGATVWTLWALKLGWMWAETIGKWIYWFTLPPNIDEASAVQTEEARAGANIKTPAQYDVIDWKVVQTKAPWTTNLPSRPVRKATSTAIEQKWIYWTMTNVGKVAERRALEMFPNEILPMLKNSKTTLNIQWALRELESEIPKLAKNDPDKLEAYKNAMEELKKSYSDPQYANYSLEDTQTLKSWLKWRTPQKFFKKKWIQAEITNEVTELKWQLWNKLTQKIHSALNKQFGKWASQKYIDYANLEWLSKVWPKSRAMAGVQWGFWWFNFTLAKELATPVTTTAGKWIYESWKLAQKIPDILLNIAKKWVKWLKIVWKWFLTIDPINTPDIMQYIPWTIWESFKKFIEQNPASQALNAINSMPITKKWKIEKIKEIYKVNDNEAQSMYKWEKPFPHLISI